MSTPASTPAGVSTLAERERTRLLVDLWHADRDTPGYHHASLLLEACRINKPTSHDQLGRLFYPDWPEYAHIDDVAMIRRVYTQWRNLRSAS